MAGRPTTPLAIRRPPHLPRQAAPKAANNRGAMMPVLSAINDAVRPRRASAPTVRGARSAAGSDQPSARRGRCVDVASSVFRYGSGVAPLTVADEAIADGRTRHVTQGATQVLATTNDDLPPPPGRPPPNGRRTNNGGSSQRSACLRVRQRPHTHRATRSAIARGGPLRHRRTGRRRRARAGMRGARGSVPAMRSCWAVMCPDRRDGVPPPAGSSS